MNLLRIAARVALTQPLSDRPDYGSREMVSEELPPEGTLAQQQEQQEQEQDGQEEDGTTLLSIAARVAAGK